MEKQITSGQRKRERCNSPRDRDPQKGNFSYPDKTEGLRNQIRPLDRDSLYGKVDDMELLEWEGELETLKRLKEKWKSLEEITFEYG
ncbi:MAG: hypothetical protein AB1611_01275 [bacterium]